MAGATVVLLDSNGATRTTSTGPDGSYQLDVAGLHAPYLLEVVGLVGGTPAVLHSAATAADADKGGTVNLTPLTELIVAYALGASPGEVFRDEARSLATLTDAALTRAAGTVGVELEPLLSAYGFTGDPRTAAFSADGTGLDRALDALQLAATQDGASMAPRYELGLITGGDPVVIDPAAPPSSAQLAFSRVDTDAVDAAAVAVRSIDSRLQALAALFGSSVPAEASVRPYFDAADFSHNGLTLDAYLSDVLLQAGYQGLSIGPASLESAIDSRHLKISVEFATPGMRPWGETLLMSANDRGEWLIAGNQELAQAKVFAQIRLWRVDGSDQVIEYFKSSISSTQLDPRIAYVAVTGPGLPTGGLRYVRSDELHERSELILQGDTQHTNIFNPVDCDAMDTSYMGGCGLDWLALHTGAEYTFRYFDAGHGLLGSAVRRLPGTPRTAAKWLARRSQVFPHLRLDDENNFWWTNLGSGSFSASGTESVTWAAPTDPTVSMDWIYFQRAYKVGEFDTDEVCQRSLYGDTTHAFACRWNGQGSTTYALVDLAAVDIYGNVFEQYADPYHNYAD